MTYRQARAAGVPAGQLGTRGSGRRFTRVRAGAYAETTTYEAADAAARLALSVAAERLVTAVDLVAVGATAAVLHDLPLLGGVASRLHLAERKEDRPLHHGTSATLAPADVTAVRGVPVTTLERTAVDVARARGYLAGVVAMDAALARGVDREALERSARACVRWPGARHARRAADLADGRAESPLESVGRVRFDEQGLPPCELQVVLGDEDGPIARVDHYWEDQRTVAEADGALKYRSPADLFAEKRREDRLREAGFEVVRYTWDEVVRQPEVVAARVRRAFARAATRRAA